MSAFVLPAELPAHKISCCVYCSLNKSPHLFSTISTTYHYSTIVYFTHCYVGLLVLIVLCRCIFFLYSTYSLLYTINKNTCLYCIVSAMNLNSPCIFVLSTYCKMFRFLNQCFARLWFRKSVSDSRNLLDGATAVLLETLFQNQSRAKH